MKMPFISISKHRATSSTRPGGLSAPRPGAYEWRAISEGSGWMSHPCSSNTSLCRCKSSAISINILRSVTDAIKAQSAHLTDVLSRGPYPIWRCWGKSPPQPAYPNFRQSPAKPTTTTNKHQEPTKRSCKRPKNQSLNLNIPFPR